MTRSSPASIASRAFFVWLFATLSVLIPTCRAQFAFSSAGTGAVASAGGVTVVAQLPGLAAINGLINGLHNNHFGPQQQQMQRLQQGRPGMGPGRGPGMGPGRGQGMGPNRRGGPPNQQQAPPGWPPGWQWGPGGNQPGFGWDQQPGWNGGGPPPRPGWNGGGGMGPGWNGGGGMGPGWNGGGRGPGWNGGGGGPPPRPGWNGGGMRPPPPPPPRPDWGGGMRPPPGWNGWDNNQPYPDYDWNNTDNGAQTTTSETPTVSTSPPTTPKVLPSPTTPKTVVTHPTFQPRPPTQPTKDTLIIGTNRPPLVPPPNQVNPTPVPLPLPLPTPVPLPYHSIEASEERPVIFPSSSKYVHLPNQEVPSEPIDVRRR